MKGSSRELTAVFADSELVQLLGEQSDLLAIADAIASVGGGRSEDASDGESAAVHASGRHPLPDGRVRWIVKRPVLALVATAFAFVVLAAPALALSPELRELVGLGSSQASYQLIVARLTSVTVHPAPRFAPPLATVNFTVGQAGSRREQASPTALSSTSSSSARTRRVRSSRRTARVAVIG